METINKWLINTIIVCSTLLAPLKPILVSVFVLVSCDFVAGIYAAFKRGDKINSAEMRRTVSKLLIYCVALICGYIVEKYLLESVFPCLHIISGVIGLTELKSILENLNSINGGDLFKQVILKLGSKNDPANLEPGEKA